MAAELDEHPRQGGSQHETAHSHGAKHGKCLCCLGGEEEEGVHTQLTLSHQLHQLIGVIHGELMHDCVGNAPSGEPYKKTEHHPQHPPAYGSGEEDTQKRNQRHSDGRQDGPQDRKPIIGSLHRAGRIHHELVICCGGAVATAGYIIQLLGDVWLLGQRIQ